MRERLRLLHYSLSTEEAWAYWCKAVIRFHGRRHPAEMGAPELEAFLTSLAAPRRVVVSTHNQALSALRFHCGKVLRLQLSWLQEIGCPTVPRRVPEVLSREEVGGVLEGLKGEHRPLERLRDGTGLRLNDALQLQVKGIDFSHQALIVRE